MISATTSLKINNFKDVSTLKINGTTLQKVTNIILFVLTVNREV